MEIIEQKLTEVVVRISKEEAVILNNALNEVCNGIDLPDFETRMGCKEAEAQKLLSAFQSVLSSD